jgi:mannose-binding lectin
MSDAFVICTDKRTHDEFHFVRTDTRPYFQLPEGSGDTAIVTLNLPQPYANGNDCPGGVFRISVNGTILPNEASLSYAVQNGNNRIPTTLVVGVPLTMKKQTVQTMWHNVRGSTVILDSPSTLSAIY